MTGHLPGGVRREQLRPGAVLRIDACASVQFGGERGLTLRVTGVDERPTYHGWIWLTGYVLGPDGSAVDRREVYVRTAGLHLQREAPAPVQVRRAVPVRV